MVKMIGYCPIHEHEHNLCGPECLKSRAALRRLRACYRTYWWHKRRTRSETSNRG